MLLLLLQEENFFKAMLEGLAAKILENYIGKYVNVNADKLSVGLLSGVVELDNVPLKPDAFNDHDLPFELKLGYVEKIKLNISLNSLRYTPLLLTADKLFIIIGPKNKMHTKSEEEEKPKVSQTGEDKSNEDRKVAENNNKQEEILNEKISQVNDYKQKLQQEKLDRLVNLENKWFKEVEFLGKLFICEF